MKKKSESLTAHSEWIAPWCAWMLCAVISGLIGTIFFFVLFEFEMFFEASIVQLLFTLLILLLYGVFSFLIGLITAGTLFVMLVILLFPGTLQNSIMIIAFAFIIPAIVGAFLLWSRRHVSNKGKRYQAVNVICLLVIAGFSIAGSYTIVFIVPINGAPSLPDKCTTTRDLVCTDYVVLSNDINLMFENSAGKPIHITSILVESSKLVTPCSAVFDRTIMPGEEGRFDISGCKSMMSDKKNKYNLIIETSQGSIAGELISRPENT